MGCLLFFFEVVKAGKGEIYSELLRDSGFCQIKFRSLVKGDAAIIYISTFASQWLLNFRARYPGTDINPLTSSGCHR